MVSKSIVLEAGSLEPEPARGEDGSGRLSFLCAGGGWAGESNSEKAAMVGGVGATWQVLWRVVQRALSPRAGPVLPLQGCS